jgi:hypothetical protein
MHTLQMIGKWAHYIVAYWVSLTGLEIFRVIQSVKSGIQHKNISAVRPVPNFVTSNEITSNCYCFK